MIMFDALEQYGLLQHILSVDRFGRGVVNRTYLAKSKNETYILQLINNNIFKKPENVIKNIESLVPYFKGKDDFLMTKNLLDSLTGTKHVKAEETYWRMYKIKPHMKIFKKIVADEMMEEIGKAVGRFQKVLLDFNPKLLVNTIANYHDAPKLYQQLYKVINRDYEKAVPLFNETKFLEFQEAQFTLIPHLLKTKQVPLRVTHNNFRLSNMLFDENTYEVLGVIGLDAIMPGTLITDFGDAARYFCSTSREDETQLEFVHFNLDYYRLFVRGFLKETKDFITAAEIDNLVNGVKVVTLEHIIRFLTAHLDPKSVYPKEYKHQHWDRAKNQIQLYHDIDAHVKEMNII
ncbi:MAG TPA: phosphotransferase, partial [Bacilli bacterium]|nr:phosphotransferase [Bacilli bacterium]